MCVATAPAPSLQGQDKYARPFLDAGDAERVVQGEVAFQAPELGTAPFFHVFLFLDSVSVSVEGGLHAMDAINGKLQAKKLLGRQSSGSSGFMVQWYLGYRHNTHPPGNPITLENTTLNPKP